MAKSKKIAIVVAAIALIAVIGVVGSTLAYFTDNDTKTNTFQTGHISGELLEKDPTGKGTKLNNGAIEFTQVMPGDPLTKEPYLQLDNDSRDAYARIKLTWETPSNWNADQNKEFADNNPDIRFNSNWVKGQDNYYYYKKIIQPGTPTDVIFDQVTIPGAWTNVMTGVNFGLKIEAEFIQAENTDDVVKKDSAGDVTHWDGVQASQITSYPATQQ